MSAPREVKLSIDFTFKLSDELLISDLNDKYERLAVSALAHCCISIVAERR